MEKGKAGAVAHIGGIPVYCAHDAIVEIAGIKPNPKNPNRHPENQVERLAGIIEKQGWRQPIKVSTLSGCIVSGHGRYQAALFMGAQAVPVDYQDYESEEAELADLLADNRIAELSEMDNKALAEVFAGINEDDIDFDVTGYTRAEYEAVMEALRDCEDEDDIPEPKERKDLSDQVQEIFEVIIECENEDAQREVFESLTAEGYTCRVLTL